jgi:hypothetical protein
LSSWEMAVTNCAGSGCGKSRFVPAVTKSLINEPAILPTRTPRDFLLKNNTLVAEVCSGGSVLECALVPFNFIPGFGHGLTSAAVARS